MQTVRRWRNAFILFSFSIGLAACTNSKPQVDFLKSVTDSGVLPGPVLKINNLTTLTSNNASPTVDVSNFNKASKVEIFKASTCAAADKLGEVSVLGSDTSTAVALSSPLTLDAVYEIYALVSAADGSSTECSQNKVVYTFDSTPPAMPGTLALVTTTHNTATPVVSVPGMETGATALLYNNSTCMGASVGSALAGAAVVNVTSSAVTEGTHTYYARAQDAAGNTSACTSSSVDYIYDITPPAKPMAVELASGAPTVSTSNMPAVDITGLNSGDNVRLYADMLCLTALLDLSVSGSPMTVTPTLGADGTYSFYARAVDSYGNASDCVGPTMTYTLDSTAPAAPNALTLINPGLNPGNSATPRLRVEVVEAGDTVQLFTDNMCTTAVASGTAAGSSILLVSSALTGGTHSFYANATDPVGNISACSTASLTYTYDNVVPTVTGITSSNADKSYGPGATIVVQVNLSEPVNVDTTNGTPNLNMDTSPMQLAVYKRGSGTALLEFEYIVQSGDSASDLNYAGTTALNSNGAFIKDFAGNNLNLSLSALSGPQTLAGSKNITIMPQPPAVTLSGDPTQRVAENSGVQNLMLSLSYESYYDMNVHIATYGNALNGVDYTFLTPTIVIPAGSTTKSFAVNIADNGTVDNARNLILSIDSVTSSNGYGGMLARWTQKELHIIDNEVTAVNSQKLATGYGALHSCVLKTDGSLYCWGANTYGQLGNNTNTSVDRAALILNSTTALKQVSAGVSHTCAIQDSDGTLWCWGKGTAGELGTGSTSSVIPAVTDASFKYNAVTVGNHHSCGIRKTTNDLYCWGDNANGKLGDGTQVARSTPTLIDLGTTYTDVSAGNGHTCGIETGGLVRCWGSNNNGQLGDASTTNRSSPTAINDGSNVYVQVSAGGNHTCAVTNTGMLRCWGANTTGQLGDGTTSGKTSPVTIAVSGVAKVVTGLSHTCALFTSGMVKCWGSNSNGQFGVGDTLTSLNPITSIASGVADISAGETHTCIITTSAETKCFGNAAYDQLGYGVEEYSKVPAYIEAGYASVASGPTHTCGVTSAGTVRCWGTSVYGAIGDGTTFPRTSPVEVIASGAIQVDVGFDFSCAVLTGGKLSCWGNNSGGRLGDGNASTYRLRPYEVISSDVLKVALGTSHACALKTGGEVVCWGDNTYGKIGNNSTTAQGTPTQVLASGATQISVSETHSCALKAGNVYCWGDNASGQFGVAAPTSSLVPYDTGLQMSSISVGKAYSCGINSANKLYCWGVNGSSQLGDGTTSTSTTPVAIDASTSYAHVDAYYNHTCGVTTGGTLKCWGSNANYQIGSATVSTTPVSVIATGVSTSSVGYFGTCSVTSTGDLQCWGANTSGQVGTGSLEFLYQPLHVLGL